MADIVLRPATAADAEFFFDLHKASLGPYVDQIWDWDDADQRAYLARNLVLEHVRVIVVDGVDVGRLDVEEGDDEIFLALTEVSAADSSATSSTGAVPTASASPSACWRSIVGRASCTGGSVSPWCRVGAQHRRSGSGWWRSRDRQRVVVSDARWLSEFSRCATSNGGN
jgi:hypothetical protein